MRLVLAFLLCILRGFCCARWPSAVYVGFMLCILGFLRIRPPISRYIRILVSFLEVCFPLGEGRNPKRNHKETQRETREKPERNQGGLISADIRFCWFAGLLPGVSGETLLFICVLSLAVWGERVGTQRGLISISDFRFLVCPRGGS